MENKTQFEEIKQFNEIGQEFWSDRELYTILEYIKWDKFLNVIEKAKQACKISGQEPDDHFPRIEKLVKIGSGAKRDIGDIHLSRYACYLNCSKCRLFKRSCRFRTDLFCYPNSKTRSFRRKF